MVQSFLSARKFWLAVFGLFFVVFLFPQTTFAQLTSDQQIFYDACIKTNVTSSAFTEEGSLDGYCRAAALTSNPGENANKIPGTLETYGGSLADGLAGLALDTITAVPAGLSELVVMLLSFGLWLAGVFFNFVVDETIIRAAQSALGSNSSNVLRPGIETAWKLVRDLINMSFIFILLYQSIQLILGRTNEAGKTIIKVAAVAILINFSIFITQVVVDASNIVAIGFYDAFTTIPNTSGSGDTVTDRGNTGGISNAYMTALGIPSVFSGIGKGIGVAITGVGATNMLIVNLFTSLLLIVTVFVFSAAAIMLLVRYIMIIFLIILSPLAFAGIILPGTQRYTKQWWETLTGQALFAPVFMIMTWVNLTLVSSLYADSNTHSLESLFQTLTDTSATNIGTDILASFFNFSLIIGTAIASLIIAKQFANRGGKGFGTLTNYIGGAALGGAAWAGRRTAGKYAQNLSNNAAFREKMGRSVFGNLALKTVDKTATGSFDARGTKLGGTIFEGMGKASSTGGYRKSFEDNVKNRKEFAERYASASQATSDAYEKAKSDVRTAKRTYANATSLSPEERMAARENLKTAEKELKKQKAQYDAEIKRSKTDYAQTATTMDILRPHVGFAPSREALEAADQIMDNLEGSDKDAAKKQDLADKKDILSKLLDRADVTRVRNFIDNEKISSNDWAEFGAGILNHTNNDLFIDKITSNDLKAIARKGEMTGAQRNALGALLNNRITSNFPVDPSINRMRGTAAGAEWGL